MCLPWAVNARAESDLLRMIGHGNHRGRPAKNDRAEVFADTLRVKMLAVNRCGMAHRSDFVTGERFVKADDLAMGRGTAFLRRCLQLLYPWPRSINRG